MSQKLIPSSAKLISQSKKDFGFATAFEYKPFELEEKNKGYLYVAIEISSAKEKAIETVELILQTLKNEYYAGQSVDASTNFENALTKLNEELSSTIEEGKIHWLGKLHAVIAILADNEIHITKTGEAQAYFLRGENLVETTKELSSPEKPHPLKTFTNIASGKGLEGDKLFLITPGIRHFFEISEINNFVKEYPPKKAVGYLADLIEKNEKEGIGAMFVLELATPEAIANKVIDETPEEIWVGEEESPYKEALKGFWAKLKPKASQFTTKTAASLGDAVSAVSDFTKKSFVPLVKKGVKKTKEGLEASKEKLIPEKPEPEELKISKRGLELTSDILEKGEEKELEELEKVEEEIEKAKEEKYPPVIGRQKQPKKLTSFANLKNSAQSIFETYKNKLPISKKSKIPLIILMLALILGGSIFFNYQNNVKKTHYEKILVSAQNKEKEASDRLIFDDKAGATKLLREARNIIAPLEKTSYKGDEVQALIKRIDSQLEKAEGIVRIADTPIADLANISGSKPNGLFIINGILYSFDQNHNSIYKINISSKEVGTDQASPAPGEKFLAGTIFETEKIAFLSDRPGVWIFDPTTQTIKKQTLSYGDWEKSQDISSFYSNIYLLVPETNSIKKYTKTSGGFSQGVDYLKQEINLSEAKSLAIDGNVYVLKSNDEILLFYGGVSKDFQIKNLPDNLKDSSKIYTDIDLENIYILDNGNQRIIVTDKEGNFVKQYKSSGFSDLKGVVIDQANGKGYVLSGTKVYEFGL